MIAADPTQCWCGRRNVVERIRKKPFIWAVSVCYWILFTLPFHFDFILIWFDSILIRFHKTKINFLLIILIWYQSFFIVSSRLQPHSYHIPAPPYPPHSPHLGPNSWSFSIWLKLHLNAYFALNSRPLTVRTDIVHRATEDPTEGRPAAITPAPDSRPKLKQSKKNVSDDMIPNKLPFNS